MEVVVVCFEILFLFLCVEVLDRDTQTSGLSISEPRCELETFLIRSRIAVMTIGTVGQCVLICVRFVI